MSTSFFYQILHTWSAFGLDLLLCFFWLCWSSADLPWDLDFRRPTRRLCPTKSSFSKLLLIEDIDWAKVLASLFSGLRDLCLRSLLIFFCLLLLFRDCCGWVVKKLKWSNIFDTYSDLPIRHQGWNIHLSNLVLLWDSYKCKFGKIGFQRSSCSKY